MAYGRGNLRIPAVVAIGGLLGALYSEGAHDDLFTRRADAQVRITMERGFEAPSAELLTDRTLSRGLNRAKERIAEGAYSEAIHFLDEVLGRSEDAFLESPEAAEVLGLKESALRAIRDLPLEGRTAYRAAFGPIAERRLSAALASGDEGAIKELAFRYFYTPSGMEAAMVQAMNEWDNGHRLQAALIYRRLLETPEATARFDPALTLRAASCWLAVGDRNEAERLLARLNAPATSQPSQQIEIAGVALGLGQVTPSVDWLQSALGKTRGIMDVLYADWLTFRGGAARTLLAHGNMPHMRERWRARLLHPKMAQKFGELSLEKRQSGTLLPVASTPVAVGDIVLMRTPHQLLAMNFSTGKRVWQAEVEENAENEAFVDEVTRRGDLGGAFQGFDGAAERSDSLTNFALRMWHDYRFHCISSDGKRVFFLGDLRSEISERSEFWPNPANPSYAQMGATNRLTALDLATEGKRIWEIRGASAKGPLAGANFLGAPTPAGGALFALVEIRSAIYLAMLDGATGEVEWLQQLATLEARFGWDSLSSFQALMPSYDSGMLVCPTEAGVVVGIDVANRSLAWAFRYETPNKMRGLDQRGRIRQDGDGEGWIVHAPTIIGGRVILTPTDANHVYCLDLRNGKLLWQRPRGEMRQLACADENTVLFAGIRFITSLRLTDGEPAWDPIDLTFEPTANDIASIGPSGNGFASGSSFFLPLTSSEIVEIDRATGRIIARVSTRGGEALGNLICHNGAVLSSDGITLNRYDEIDLIRKQSTERLNESPGDADALRTLGEIAFDEGRIDDSIRLLESALRQSPDDYEVRAVLADSLSAALERDFAAYRSRIGLLEDLQRDVPGKRSATLRLRCQGLLDDGDFAGAAAACFELVELLAKNDLAKNNDELVLGRGYSAKASRWVRAQLSEIWRRAPSDVRQSIEDAATQFADVASPTAGGDSPSPTSDYFDDLPFAGARKLRRAQNLAAQRELLAAQQLLLDLADGTDPALREEAQREATELLAASGLETMRPRDLHAWPTGKVDVQVEITKSARSGDAHPRMGAPWEVRKERSDATLDRSTFLVTWHNNGGELSLRDGWGRETMRVPLVAEAQAATTGAASVYCVTRGGLIIASLGREIAAIDALFSTDNRRGRVLWRAPTVGQLNEMPQFDVAEAPSLGSRPGLRRPPRAQSDGEWIGVIGPATSNGCVFQNQRRLVCLDLMSGELMWSRSDLPSGCDLVGDHAFIFATPRGAANAYVYSAVDGRYLGKRTTPKWGETLANRGRQAVYWRKEANQGETLGAVDLESQKTLWNHAFSNGSCVDVAASRFASVVQPDGRIVVVDLEDGALLVDYSGPPLTDVKETRLLAGSDSFVIVVEMPRSSGEVRHVSSLLKEDYPIVSGKVLAFDRGHGRMLWSRAAEVELEALAMTQPMDLPVIAFVGTLQSQQASGSRSAMTLLVLDKRTGQTVLRRDDLPPAAGGWCDLRIGALEENQVLLETRMCKIGMTFTDRPAPPSPPAMTEVERSAAKSSGGLKAIFSKSLETPLQPDANGNE